MKKILSNFANSLISRDQMKNVKGGCGSGNCPFTGTLNCPGGVSHTIGGQNYGDLLTLTSLLCGSTSGATSTTSPTCW